MNKSSTVLPKHTASSSAQECLFIPSKFGRPPALLHLLYTDVLDSACLSRHCEGGLSKTATSWFVNRLEAWELVVGADRRGDYAFHGVVVIPRFT